MPFEEHPYLDTPPDDTVLWRYLSLARFMELLDKGTLWFSRLDLYEDPLEGTFTDLELEHVRKLPVVPSPRGSESIGESWLRFIEHGRISHYANCWREGKNESMAMWDIYARSGVGLAIKSDVRRLKAALENCDKRVFLGRVNYILWAEMLTWPNNAIVQCFRKDRSYEHEVEVRAVISALDDDPRYCLKRKGIEVAFDPFDFIKEVVVGPREQSDAVRLVDSILKNHGLMIPVKASNRLTPR